LKLQEIYDTPEDALSATDDFYRNASGFGYDIEKLTSWLTAYGHIPKAGRILDLCCGDGIWSRAYKELNPAFDLYGIDISEGGIEKARDTVGDDKGQFVVGDVEHSLPFPKKHFSLIFARGTGIYNQHDMSRSATIKVIEMWHEYLADGGIFCGIYGSTPQLMGSYTPIEKVKLPYNRAPRQSDAVQFDGGKFHHTIQSFHAPFWAAESIEVVDYRYAKKKHIILTRRKKT
jgi:SAM-dependent methyltransferase